jgi:hypothetical protein
LSPCRILVFLCIDILSAVPVTAQTPDPISADRPGIADSSSVVGRGRLQIEMGAQWEKRRSEFSTFFPTLFRAGLTSRLEARVEGDTYTTIADVDQHESGLTPISLGFKALLKRSSDAAPAVGVIASVTPAWGTGAFAAEKASADARLVVDWNLSEHWSLNPNAGLAWTEGTSGAFMPGLLALTLSYQPRPGIEWFIDGAAELPEAEDGTASIVVDAGIAYIPRQRCQLDISAGTRAHGRTGPKPFISVGFSIRTR